VIQERYAGGYRLGCLTFISSIGTIYLHNGPESSQAFVLQRRGRNFNVEYERDALNFLKYFIQLTDNRYQTPSRQLFSATLIKTSLYIGAKNLRDPYGF